MGRGGEFPLPPNRDAIVFRPCCRSHLFSPGFAHLYSSQVTWFHIASSTLPMEMYYVAVYHVFNVKVLILGHTSLSPFKKDDHQIAMLPFLIIY